MTQPNPPRPADPLLKTDPDRSIHYQIRVQGCLDAQWAHWFEGLTIRPTEGGHTLITGPVMDQAALYGLLKKVRDLGMTLISVNPIETDGATESFTNVTGDY